MPSNLDLLPNADLSTPAEAQKLPAITPVGVPSLDSLPDDPALKKHPLASVFKQASAIEPDRAAKVFRIADRSGQPHDFVDANLDEASKAAEAPTDEWWARFEQDHPQSASRLLDPKVMASARDDAANMGQHEAIGRSVSEAHTLLGALDAGWQGSVAGLGLRAVRGQGLPDVVLPEDAPEYQRLASMAASLAPDLPLMWAGGIMAAGPGASVGLALGGPPGAITGAAISGFGGSFALPAFMRTVLLQSLSDGDTKGLGGWARRAWDIAKESSKGYITGAATGFVGGPVVSKLGGKVISKLAAEAITMPVVGEALEGRIATPRIIAENTLLLGAMHGVGYAGGYGKNFLFPREINDSINLAVAQAAVPQMDAAAKASRWRGRDPEGYGQHMDAVLPPARIPVSGFERYFQSQNIDPAKAAEEMGVSESYSEARSAGSDVVIPARVFQSTQMDPHRMALVDDVKFKENSLTANELKDLNKEVDANLKEGEANADFKAGFQKLYEGYRSQFLTAGQPEALADKNAKIYARVAAVSAVRDGVPIEEAAGLRVYGSEKEEFDNARLAQPAWHGSPHDFEQFSLQKIGTGEGAASYGWGLYFTNERKIADFYRNAGQYGGDATVVLRSGETLAGDKLPDALLQATKYLEPVRKQYGAAGEKWVVGEALRRAKMDGVRKDILSAIKKYGPDFQSLEYRQSRGRIYKVEIPEDADFLDLDKTYAQQSPKVRAALEKERQKYRDSEGTEGLNINETYYGRDIYSEAKFVAAGSRNTSNAPELASRHLSKLGIAGVKYRAGQISGVKSEASNYVVFDDKLIRIQEKLYQERARAFYDPESRSVVLGKSADASSAIHELSHDWLQTTFKMVGGEQAPAWRKESAQAVKKWWADNPEAVVSEIRRDIKDIKLRKDRKKGFSSSDAERLKELEKVIAEIPKRGGEKYVASMAEKNLESADFVEREINRQFHELFARGFESFFREGKLPAPELRGVFASFRRWLGQIYKSALDLRVNVSPDVKNIFSRMLATDTEIEAAEQMVGSRKLKSPQARSMQEQAHEAAVKTLMSKQMEEVRQDRLKKMDAERAKAANAARKELADSPLYRAMVDLGRGSKASMADAEAKRFKYARLFAERYLRGTSEDSRVIFDYWAAEHGFSSGDEMAKAILKAPDFAEVIARRVAEHMKQFPDLMETDAIKTEAMKAIHGEAQVEALAVERMAAGRPEEVSAEVARQRRARAKIEREVMAARAKAILSTKSVTAATNFQPYFTAERNAAIAASKAEARGDQAAAYKARGQQMLNHLLALESIRIQERVDILQKQIGDIRTRKIESFKDQRHLDQVADMLRRFALGSVPGYRQLTKVEALSDWARRADEEFGMVQEDANGNKVIADGSGIVNMADWILSTNKSLPWKDLTVSELEDVTNALKNIVHVANYQDKAFVLGKGAEISALATDLVYGALKYVGAELPRTVEPGKFDRAKAGAQDYLYSLERIDSTTQELDGWKDGGIWQKTLKDSQRERANVESNLRMEYKDGMEKLWSAYDKNELRELFDKEVYHEEVGASMTKQRLLAMALNLGNKEGREKVFTNQPYGFNEAIPYGERTVMDLLTKNLTEKDWKFVTGVWKLMEKLFPLADANHQELSGFKMNRVELEPFSVLTADGKTLELDGGYYPLRPDPRALESAAVRELAGSPLHTELNPGVSSYVKRGYTKSRTRAQYAVSLDLTTIDRHFSEVIHDIAFRGLVVDLNRVLGKPDLMNFVKRYKGDVAYRNLQQYVRSLASGGDAAKLATDALSHVARTLNSKTTTAMVIGRVGVILQNFANPWLAIGASPDFGAKDVFHSMIVRGLSDYWVKWSYDWKAARGIQEATWAKSPFMRDRRHTPEYTLSEVKGAVGTESAMREFFVGLLGWSDDMTNIPIWQEAYHKKMRLGAKEEDAVRFADTIIERISGSGRKYDQPRIMRGSDIERLVSKLYSFWNVEYMNWRRTAGITAQDPIGNSPQLLAFAASRAMFIATSALLVGDLPDKAEDSAKWATGLLLKYPMSFFPGVRDIGNVLINQKLGLRSYGYRFAPLASSIEAFTNLDKKLSKAVSGEGDVQPAIEAAMKVASLGLITPAYPDQFNAWFWNGYDYLANGMDPRPSDLLRRRPSRERR